MVKKTNKPRTIESLFVDLLLGLARFFLRRHIPFQQFVDLARQAYVLAAREQLSKTTEKINSSRLSVMTGITRREVKNILDGEWNPARRSATLVSRVLSQWEQDRRFHDKRGRPRPLTYHSEDSEFYQLVSSVSQHLNPGTLLFEVRRIGAVKEQGDKLKLLRVDHNQNDEEEWRLELAGLDLSSLLTAVQDNIEHPEVTRNAHFRTEYDNIALKKLPEARKWILKEVGKFHKRVRDYLSSLDRDLNPSLGEEGGGKISVSTIGHVERNDPSD